ncbi:LacI family DNA-binding transcriptional regulator [Tsukamurella sputi]|uniref:LacI family DNA-binding transcriptional regulator n=1 Tax=Tsukamurella sputi TaxID=2591848 RepID=UPI00195FECDA|nr:LacI family DNA-binding transcriptional regulator [Tsukamurella sputi]
MTKRRTSLADVARAAGVGLATASRALSGNADVAQATRDRVLDTASSLGYRPSAAAQALRTGRSRTVAVAVGSPIAADVLEGVLRACTRAGYQVLLQEVEALAAGTGSHEPDPGPDGRIAITPDGGGPDGSPAVTVGHGTVTVSVSGRHADGAGVARGEAAATALVAALGAGLRA